jgi:protein disulfide-isomerase
METLGEFVEKTLEQSKPGTRPKTFVLPKPGDKGLPNQTAGKEHGDTIASPANTLPAAAKSPASQALSPPIPPPIAPKKRGPMNTEGESVTLTLDNFEQRVTKSDEPWLIKFYAPWCHHCQAMAPKWAQMAKTMKGKLNVGQVNCDQEKRLCKSLDVHAYPTILFFDGEEHVEYRGLRGLGDFISYAEKGLQLTTTIPDVDAESFKTMEAEDDVIFVYFHDHATTTEDFEAVKKLPLHLIGRAKIVTTSDPAMFRRFKITTWPRMLVSREGRPSYYDPITPREMRDVKLLLDWIKTVWLPLVPELTAATATEIMQGKIVALAVLSRGQDALFASSQREIKSVANDWMDREIQEFQRERKKLRDAKKMRIDEAEDRNDQRAVRNAKNIRIDMHQTKHKDVAFAWVDGVFWLRWLKTTYGVDVHQGERVIIIDEDVSLDWSCFFFRELCDGSMRLNGN